MDTSSVHIQRGTFAAEQNLYQRSLRERLPEDVETVSSIVDTRSAMRNVSCLLLLLLLLHSQFAVSVCCSSLLFLVLFCAHYMGQWID